jgi:pyruvate,water dikinase
MDIEWAKDGKTSKLYIVQARPETVHSQRSSHLFVTYQIKPFKAPIVKGIAVGNQAVSANVNIVTDPTNHESF